MRYVSEKTLRTIFAAFDHDDPARHRRAAEELVKRKVHPEALVLLRVARASEADAAIATELATHLDDALKTCGIKADPDSSGRINLAKLSERLVEGDLAHKLRALELLIWFPVPQSFTMLADALQSEPEPWIRAAMTIVLAEAGGPAASGVLHQLATSEGRAAACARYALSHFKPPSRVIPAPVPVPEPAPADPPSSSADVGSVSCPMCQAAVALSRRTMGDLVNCDRCGMGFRLTLETGASGAPPTIGTQAVEATQIEPPGQGVLSRFEILGELGRGGQGAVYRARPRDGKKEFALKYLDSMIQSSSNALLANQDIASMLEHPNIVSVFATGLDEPGRRTYAVYEIVEGKSLSALLKDGPLPVEKALDIMFQVLAGLAHSHAQGVVHRDLKPDNILVTHAGVAKIADFGIGILVGDTEKLSEDPTPFVGTPGYAAPEQITGWGAVRASDVYALGMTLYEMITGRLPFPAPTLEVLLHNQVNTAPRPPSTYIKDLPPPVEAVILQCLEKSPAKRPGWAGEMLDKLRAAARGGGQEVPLATSEGLPEPRRIDSFAGLKCAWPALLAGALVFGGPLALVFSPLKKLVGEYFVVGLTAWLVALILFARHARSAAGSRAPHAVLGHIVQAELSGSARGAGIVPIFVVLLPILIRSVTETPAERIDSLPYYVPTIMAIAIIMLFPVWSAWMDKLLADPAEAHLERGTSVLALDGPRGFSCQVDGGPASRLPCKVLIKPGLHRIVVSGEGHTQKFSLMVSEASLRATKLTVTAGGIVDHEGDQPTPSEGLLRATFNSPLTAGLVAIGIAVAGLALLARILGQAFAG